MLVRVIADIADFAWDVVDLIVVSNNISTMFLFLLVVSNSKFAQSVVFMSPQGQDFV